MRIKRPQRRDREADPVDRAIVLEEEEVGFVRPGSEHAHLDAPQARGRAREQDRRLVRRHARRVDMLDGEQRRRFVDAMHARGVRDVAEVEKQRGFGKRHGGDKRCLDGPRKTEEESDQQDELDNDHHMLQRFF